MLRQFYVINQVNLEITEHEKMINKLFSFLHNLKSNQNLR